MPSIREICYDDVPTAFALGQLGLGVRLMAIWPAPVNADACFAAAGFSEFDDPDEIWDEQWRRIVQLLIDELSNLGTASLKNVDDVFQGRPSRLFGLIKSTLQPIQLTAVDRIVLSTHEDRVDDAVVEFGNLPHAATLRTGTGHPVLWIVVPEGARLSASTLAEKVAEGRPCRACRLRWEQLWPGSH